MEAQVLSRYTGVPTKQINRLLSMSGQTMAKDPEFINLLNSLDKDHLEETLPEARAAYEKGLPAFERHLHQQYGLETTPMSAFTLGNWVVGALQFPQYTNKIMEMHENIPREVFVNELPRLLDMLDHVRGGREWQRALCVFSLPLMRL